MKLLLDNQLKDYILTNIPQERMFAFYLGISELDIIYCLNNTNEKIRNPIRTDNNPSLTFKYYGKKLYMRDYGNNNFNMDIFALVGFIHNLNCNSKYDFPKICNIIIDNMENKIPKYDKSINKVLKQVNKSEYKEISIQIRKFKDSHINYWKQFNVDKKDLMDNYVFPILRYWIDDNEYGVKELSFAYYLGVHKDIDLYKLYFPKRNKKLLPKFITNSKAPIECLWEFRNTENLIITKSRKDAIIWKKIVDINKFSIVNFSSEAIRLNDKVIEAISNKYKHVIIDSDNDEEGRSCGEFYSQKRDNLHSLIPYWEGCYQQKDLSDNIMKYGFDNIKNNYNEFVQKICTK